jgi:hypothetical protein
MERSTIAMGVSIVAILIAVMAILSAGAPQPAGITYDVNRQPSVFPLKDLTASSPEAATGIILDYQKINTSQPGGNTYIGEVVYLEGSTWIRASSGATSTLAGKLGMVVKAPTSNTSATGQVLLQGLVYNGSWSLTRGTVYYANSTTPGTFNTVKPQGSDKIQSLGWAYNTTVFYFNPPINASANGI